jgi:hypothetical protein
MTVLPPTNPDKIDQAVTAHLVRTLDRQRGRAALAFRAQIGGEGRSHSFERAQEMRSWRWWAGAASALAACVALVVTLQFVGHSGTGAQFTGSRPEVAGMGGMGAPAMDQVELSRDVDGGTVVLDDQTPVHVVREQTLRQTQWFDPREQANYSITQPVERVNYVPMQAY